MDKKYIMAFDQGTTSSRAIIFDKKGKIKGSAQKQLNQIYPHPSWVEHEPMEIWGTQSGVARQVLEKTGIRPEEVAAIGITNQRETTIMWNKKTGKPIYNGIGWQCRRTADICDDLKDMGMEDYIKENTGLVLDAYFSGSKIKWILIRTAEESEYMATRVEDSDGVYMVPAFVGMGAPYWDMYARGTIIGITRGTKA